MVFKTTVEKCPTCGGDALCRSEFWEAVIENGDEVSKQLHKIKVAIGRYYLALDRRHHGDGDIAAWRALAEIEKAMDMQWKRGEMLKKLEENPRLRQIYDGESCEMIQ